MKNLLERERTGSNSQIMRFIAKRARYSTLSKAVNSLRVSGEKLTGQSEVLYSQNQVKQKKDELKVWRTELAVVTKSYEDVQMQLKGLYARKTQIYQDQRRELSLLQAINNEEETLLFEEQKLCSRVEECKLKERESFESLSDAIQDSHEKERAQSERMKYYARIGSLMGAFLGFLGSSFFVKREIRHHNTKQMERLEHIENSFQTLQSQSLGGVLQGREMTKHVDLEKCVQQLEKQVSLSSDNIKTLVTEIRNFGKSLESQNQSRLPFASPGLPSNVVPRARFACQKSDSVMLGSVMSYSLVLAVLALL